MKTILEVLDDGTQWLAKKGIDDARRNMQLMLCHQLDCSKIQLYTRFDEQLSEAVLIPLREQVTLRGEGVPLQHLLGTVEFYRREFKTDARALIPRPETEELVELVCKEITDTFDADQPLKILDMGCGSGVIGLTLAAEMGNRAKVTCIDTSQEALALAQENNQLLGLDNVTFSHGNLFSNHNIRYDVIVANLPYVAEDAKLSLAPELRYDPDLALFGGKDGLDIINLFIHQSQHHRNNPSIIALEIGIGQALKVEQMLMHAGYQAVATKIDLSGISRFPIAHFHTTQTP